MTDDLAWLTVPDFADRLGTTASRVREMLREGELLAVRRGERQTLQIPAGVIVDGEAGPEVLATLRGTLTLLRDAGMDDAEMAAWLMADEPELGMSPLDALREGRRAHVRRIAQTLL
ncbi:Rv2175c family DNA-binding protein [Demequina soli]|uniref:Rv2175c family DNA-binding protein n=1 Tax=Demequina soli TaxID=1638987 RepID=UPI00078238F5|nr:Rv2175c family DNA-binding protein [Demequina soli]